MQEYQLTVVAQYRPETLERLLRVIRHRGFTVIELNAQVDEITKKIQLSFKLKSIRALDLVINQLSKLYDVESVEQK